MLLISAIPSFLGLSENTSFNDWYRILVALISIFFIFKSIFNQSVLTIKKKYIPLFIFIFFYFIRILYDLYIVNVDLLFDELTNSYRNNSYYLMLFTAIVLLPILGILSLDFKRINYLMILNWTYYILFAILLYSILFRNIYDSTLRSSGILKLSVLIYGHYGASLIILSIYKIYKMNNNFINKIIYSFGIIIGVVTIFVSGSRSPLIAIMITLIYFYYKKLNLLKSTIIISLVLLVISNYYMDIIALIDIYFPNTFFDRILTDLNNYNSMAGRELHLMFGIQEFIKNPILGNSFVITTHPLGGAYPHNIFIEAFMALGIFGGFLFLFINYRALSITSNIVSKTNYEWIGLLFIQFFVFSLFSGNLYSSTFYWIFLILVMNNNYQNSKVDK